MGREISLPSDGARLFDNGRGFLECGGKRSATPLFLLSFAPKSQID